MSKTNTNDNKSGAAKALDTAASSALDAMAESWMRASSHNLEMANEHYEKGDNRRGYACECRASIYQRCVFDLREFLSQNAEVGHASRSNQLNTRG